VHHRAEVGRITHSTFFRLAQAMHLLALSTPTLQGSMRRPNANSQTHTVVLGCHRYHLQRAKHLHMHGRPRTLTLLYAHTHYAR
jgi:hypothetical protein